MSENVNTQKPDNFLVWAILSTVLCCLPFGIVAIIQSTKVDSAWSAGDNEGAERAAKEARKWTFIAAGTGLAVMVIYLILLVFVAILA